MSACIWILNAPTSQKWIFFSENCYIFWFLVVLWPGWNHYGKAWRSICRKNDIRERWLASKHGINGYDHIWRDVIRKNDIKERWLASKNVINGYDHIWREWSHSLGKAGVPRNRAWEAGGFVSNSECCSSTRATIRYREKSCKMQEDTVRCSSPLPSLVPGWERHF